ncbi:hypothetical protein DFJ63DRAFT_312629 [Scheffersomyces coipomensis]|uniref:uncharacterized protein n=1 Tax=Scheffersomyces coipomensis TaxID=1788519 RepID=UPI00315CE8A3
MLFSAPTTQVRLPSISELTARSPINDMQSPRLRNDSRVLPTLSASSFRYPLKATTPSNYVLGNGSVQKLPSPTLPPPSAPVQSPQSQLISPPQPVQPYRHSSAGSSPSTHYQYYQYQSPIIPQASQQSPSVAPQVHHQQVQQQPAPPQQQVQQPHGVSVVPVQGQAQYYSQPVYYQAAPMSMNPQYAVPEVINKPTNKCHRCGTTETPEWRRGPKGVRTLCNACGLFHAKLVKRKGAALAAEEVLNNKVCKGKNGRRISIKKHLLNESLKNSNTIKGGDYHQHQVQTIMASPQNSAYPGNQPQPPQSTALVATNSLPLPPPISSHYPPHFASTQLTHHIESNSNYPTHISMPLIRH